MSSPASRAAAREGDPRAGTAPRLGSPSPRCRLAGDDSGNSIPAIRSPIFNLRGRFGHIESPHREALSNFAPDGVRASTRLGCENTFRACSAARRRCSSVHGSDSISRISGTKKPPMIFMDGSDAPVGNIREMVSAETRFKRRLLVVSELGQPRTQARTRCRGG